MNIMERLRRRIRRDAPRPVGWSITAPFVFFIELGCSREDGSTHYPLDAARWAKVIDGISRYTGEVFLEGEEPLAHPEAASILEALDGRSIRYHVASRGTWTDARTLVNRLRKLKWLDTLRLLLDSFCRRRICAARRKLGRACVSRTFNWPWRWASMSGESFRSIRRI